MSIEDPRLSSIDNTSAADDFDSAVEQHLGFASETGDGIEVAQAETPEAGRTDRLPAQEPVQVAATTIPTEVRPNEQNVVTLPAGIELDNLEFQVDGENLVLILADGVEIYRTIYDQIAFSLDGRVLLDTEIIDRNGRMLDASFGETRKREPGEPVADLTELVPSLDNEPHA